MNEKQRDKEKAGLSIATLVALLIEHPAVLSYILNKGADMTPYQLWALAVATAVFLLFFLLRHFSAVDEKEKRRFFDSAVTVAYYAAARAARETETKADEAFLDFFKEYWEGHGHTFDPKIAKLAQMAGLAQHQQVKLAQGIPPQVDGAQALSSKAPHKPAEG